MAGKHTKEITDAHRHEKKDRRGGLTSADGEKARKLTVKDIVEECHITRQSFYYHFEDIPDLLRWVLEQGLERMMEETQAKKNGEESIRYFFLMAVNAMPYVRKTMESNYGEEMEHLLRQQIFRLFERAVEEARLYQSCSQSELKLILRYHSSAVIGLLQEWTEEDTRNLDQIAHEVYQLITGGISPFSE